MDYYDGELVQLYVNLYIWAGCWIEKYDSGELVQL